MFWKSLQWRLVSIFITITLVLIILISVILYVQVQSNFYEVFRISIKTGFDQLNEDLKESGNEKPSLEKLKKILNDEGAAAIFFSISGIYKSYMILDKQSLEIEYSSDDKYKPGEIYAELFESSNLSDVIGNKETGDSNKPNSTSDGVYFDYAQYMPLKDNKECILYFRNDKSQWQGVIDRINKIIMFCALISICVSVILGYIFARTLTVPITKVMMKAQLIAAGDFDQVLAVRSDDEIGKLTETFNVMAKELKKTLSEISSEKNKMETILNYMTDGVIAFNNNGSVIHANPAAKKMVGFRDLYSSFDEFSQKYGLNVTLEDIINQILFENESGTKENFITLENKKIYRVYYAPITNKRRELEGLVVVLQDVTEQQQLENMRKEFVANVSHELKTPLTSIKSYAETLMEGNIDDDATEKRFLGVIDSEADRMTRLVRDLLQLSSFDNERMTWNMQDVYLPEILKRSIDKLAIEAKSKNQKITYNIAKEFPEMYLDEDRMEQVILNILSNAIKYTPKDGKVRINLMKDNMNAILTFTDTGMGIPEKDLARIFERFYRVDKARSREMGGTGLGLSIAKEIVEYHEGTIKVESGSDKGTKVIITLPL